MVLSLQPILLLVRLCFLPYSSILYRILSVDFSNDFAASHLNHVIAEIKTLKIKVSKHYHISEMSLPVIRQRDLKTYQIVKTSTEYVYKSTYGPTGSSVFIKLLALAERNDRDRQAILRAVEYVSRRRSERLIEIVGIFRTPNTIGIVTEWMSNESLHSLLYQPNLYPILPMSISIKILTDVAAGMSFLHNQQPPIMLRRLKPCNVLLDAQYQAKLSDFWLLGHKKVHLSKEQQEDISMIYLSPQRLKKHMPILADDVYSFGIIIHETLCRKQPFQENNPLKLVTEITRGIRPQPDIDVILKETSLEHCQRVNLSQLTHLCWHDNPAMRPTAAECLSRLNNTLQNFSKEDIQHEIDSLNKGKTKATQPEDCTMEFDIKYLDDGWQSKSHISRAQSAPEEITEERSIFPEKRKEKRSASLSTPSSKTNIPFTSPEQRSARNYGVNPPQSNVEGCVSCPYLVWGVNFVETLKRNRETILKRVTIGHLNYLIDTMRSKFVFSRDDSEIINAEKTLKDRTRKCLDICSEKGEEASRIFILSLCSRNVISMHPRNPA